MRSQLASFVTAFSLLFATGFHASALDLLYVGMSEDTIVTFDTSSNNGALISSSATIFANTHLYGVAGLVFDSSGNLFAANSGDNTISKFNASGDYLSNITTNLNTPQGIAIDPSGNLFAVNSAGGSVSKYNAAGGYVSTIHVGFTSGTGLAIDQTGLIYVGDQGDKMIYRLDADGNQLGIINLSNLAVQELALDSSGNLYAANFSNGMVEKFDSSGGYLGGLGSYTLGFTIGVAVDSSGNVYASDSDNRLFKMNAAGTILASWTIDGSFTPKYLAVKPARVPEPSTYALSLIAAGSLAALARRRKTYTR